MAVIHLTQSVAMELGESGVRVNCICSGGIATPIFGKALGLSIEAADQTVETRRHLLGNVQPLRRAGLREDIAKAALWLASDGSSFVNGHAVVVDGGLSGGRMWTAVQEQRTMLRSAFGLNSLQAKSASSARVAGANSYQNDSNDASRLSLAPAP